MKNIQDILKKKKALERGGKIAQKALDEKTLSRVFLEAAKGEIRALEDKDIREISVKDKTFFIKTAHPAVSSELLLRQEAIKRKVNEIAGEKKIEKIFVN